MEATVGMRPGIDLGVEFGTKPAVNTSERSQPARAEIHAFLAPVRSLAARRSRRLRTPVKAWPMPSIIYGR